MFVKSIPPHHIRDDLKLGSFNIGFDDHSEMGWGALTQVHTLITLLPSIIASAQLPGFGNSSRIRKLPLPHNICDEFCKPDNISQRVKSTFS